MHCLRASRSFLPSFSLTFPSPKHSLPTKLRFSRTNTTAAAIRMSSSTIEHVVLFKVKDDTDPTKVNSMISSLNGLVSLDPVLHLTTGPLHRVDASPFPFTHILHSRYASKDDLASYSAHPRHLSVVKESVFPICDDIMAVDWVFSAPSPPPPSPAAGSAVRVTFLKLKEGLGEGEKGEVLETIKGVKESFSEIESLSYGENFSPARAKGYSIASLAVFKGLEELKAVQEKEAAVNAMKEKVREYLESVIVLDFVVPAPPSASL